MINSNFICKFLFTLSLALSALNIYFVSFEAYKNFSNTDGVIFQNKKTIGGDYLAFFTGGNLFKNDRIKLYSRDAQHNFQENLINKPEHETGFLPFVYPPLVAYLFSLISSYPLITSYIIWASLSFIMYLGAVIILLREFKLNKKLFYASIIIAIGLPSFLLKTIFGGQSGAIGVLLCSLLFISLKNKKFTLSGILSALFYYKPPLFILLTISSFFKGRRKYLFGFIGMGASLILLSLYIVPSSVIEDYINVSISHSYGGTQHKEVVSVPHKGAGIFALINSYNLISKNLQHLSLLLFYILLSILFYKFRNNINTDKIFFSLTLTSSLYFSIHILDYDLCILIIPLILTLTTLYKENLIKELNLGLLFLAIYQLDLTIPYIQFEKHSLSAYSIINGFFLVYLFWVYYRYRRKINL